jgi:hypothetical protein
MPYPKKLLFPPPVTEPTANAPLDLGAVQREAVPLRVAFLHAPTTRGGPGPLASLVSQRRTLALDLLLFAHAIWPLTSPDAIVATASDWARALGLKEQPGNRAMISRSWSWLEHHRLIATAPSGRVRAIEPLCDDGSGRLWQHPSDEKEAYFRLPHAYWRGGFARDLSLSAKAMLLVGISLQGRNEPYFELPLERGSAWYGLSRRTARLGLRELEAARLLRAWTERRPSERSPTGYTFDRRYSLNPIEAVALRRLHHAEQTREPSKTLDGKPR